jgi:hypothetical protein
MQSNIPLSCDFWEFHMDAKCVFSQCLVSALSVTSTLDSSGWDIPLFLG